MQYALWLFKPVPQYYFNGLTWNVQYAGLCKRDELPRYTDPRSTVYAKIFFFFGNLEGPRKKETIYYVFGNKVSQKSDKIMTTETTSFDHYTQHCTKNDTHK